MLRTNDQNKRLHTLLAKLGIDRSTDDGRENFEDMVYKATNGRTTHSSKMLITECQAVINNLKVMQGQRVQEVKTPAPEFENSAENKMRRKILSICREMGPQWYRSGYNWEHINKWLFKYGYLHKGLNEYTKEELPKLITQFENLLKSHYAKG